MRFVKESTIEDFDLITKPIEQPILSYALIRNEVYSRTVRVTVHDKHYNDMYHYDCDLHSGEEIEDAGKESVFDCYARQRISYEKEKALEELLKRVIQAKKDVIRSSTDDGHLLTRCYLLALQFEKTRREYTFDFDTEDLENAIEDITLFEESGCDKNTYKVEDYHIELAECIVSQINVILD